MTELHLDLTSAKVKLARARSLLERLDRDIDGLMKANCPYQLQCGDVDPLTGWCPVVIVATDLTDLDLGSRFGEVVSNLRSALNYVVIALAHADGVPISSEHAFPIHTSADAYAQRVGSKTASNPTGCLGGISRGLEVIEEVQPYHELTDSDGHPLSLVRRFSNADKHHAILANIPMLERCLYDVEPRSRVVEHQFHGRIHDWFSVNGQEVGRVRFTLPLDDLRPTVSRSSLQVVVGFSTIPTQDDPEPFAISLGVLEHCCDYVETLLERLRSL